mmetsp:Transcript_48675/g.155527  ORF Transcript_48675/g.155527 Transcript_48675/m.155527 type:complete len:224 (+) Transcript_48675:185-856(+)
MLVPGLQRPVHEVQQRFVHLNLSLGHLGHRLPHLVLHLSLDVLAVLEVTDAPVDDLLLLDLVVLLRVPAEDLGLDVLQVPLVLLPAVLLLHLPAEVRLVLPLQLCQTGLLKVLRLKEVPVHLLLLRVSALRVVVPGALLHGRDVLLELLHELRLPLQALRQLLTTLLLLLVQHAVVLPHGLRLTPHLLLLVLLALPLVRHVLLKDLPHVPLRLLLLLLKPPLL